MTLHVPDELVALAKQGDRAAVGLILAIIRPPVVRYCRARLGPLTGSPVSADDLAQEVCLAVMTALPRYRPLGRPFLAFVYGVASRQVARALRSAGRHRAEPFADPPETATTDEGPEQHALRVELGGRLDRLLATLPARQREVLLLRVVMGLSTEETAAAMRSTPGAVRVAQHRALARLRTLVPTWVSCSTSEAVDPYPPRRERGHARLGRHDTGCGAAW